MRNNSLPFAFFEGKIFPVEQAKVSIMTSSLQYGITVLEGIPSYISADKKYITIFKLPDYYMSQTPKGYFFQNSFSSLKRVR